jgi:GT2 family glycosyltransferase
MLKMDLTIIIVNWNNKKILQDCLKSIYNTHANYKCKIIVVDNHSEDGSVELIENQFPDIKLIKNKENVGLAKANNQGIKMSKTDYILLLNNDTIITHKNIFIRMARFMQENPAVGVLGCKLLFLDGTLQSLGEDYTSVWGIFKRQILFSKTWERLRENRGGNNFFKKVDWVLGACLLTRRIVIKKIGMLKEEYFMCGGDVEFCYRANKAGWKVGVLTGESIIHLVGKSSEKNLINIFYHSINNNLENIKIIYNNDRKVNLAKAFYLIGVLMRAVLALFRKDKKIADYLEIFMKILHRRIK